MGATHVTDATNPPAAAAPGHWTREVTTEPGWYWVRSLYGGIDPRRFRAGTVPLLGDWRWSERLVEPPEPEDALKPEEPS